MQMRSPLPALILLVAMGAPFVFGSDTKVGDTKDGCDKSNAVTFTTGSGKATVKANSSPPAFDLPGLTREITWYCGGSRERSANGSEFNKVKISRASNGAIQWTFFRSTTDGADANPQTRMGDSRDACDASQPVTFSAKDGPVTLKVGQMVFKELPQMTREVKWKCGDSKERVANPNAFDFIQAERAGNGAIQWVFYRTMKATDESTGAYLDLLPGDIVIQAPTLNKTVPMPGFLKQQLDNFWDTNLKDLQTEILKSLQGDKRFDISSLTLSPSAQAELRVGETRDDVRLKYVVHQNTAMVSKSPANFRAVFDLELVMILPRGQKMPIQATSATAFVHHFELHGASPGDDFLAAFAKSRIHAVESNSNGFTRDVKDKVNAALAQVSKQIGAPDGTPLTLDQTSGTVQACVKVRPVDKCSFPAVAARAVPSRKALGTSHDQCSESTVWIWDHQRGTFMPVAKGRSAVIEVDNQRFEWFCGGTAQPDYANDEWATGPEGTYFVQMKRDPSGRQIDWTFLSWH